MSLARILSWCCTVTYFIWSLFMWASGSARLDYPHTCRQFYSVTFVRMTHAMYSFLKRSTSSFFSTFCFFRGGGYTSLLLDSADTAICSFNISYYCCIIGMPWKHAVHRSVPIPRPEGKKKGSLGTRPVHFEVMKQEPYAAWFLGTKLGPNCA